MILIYIRRKNQIMKHSYFTLVLILIATSLLSGKLFSQNNQTGYKFTFAFITDIHLQPETHGVEGFGKAIENINQQNPDFVITGGDLIMDALGTTYGRADSLYNLYKKESAKFNMPVYNTIGNHEIYGIYDTTFGNASHPEYGEKIFESRLGKSYYSFMHKGWKFMVLNSAEDTKKNRYIGMIDSVQMEWIKSELEKTGSDVPIVISTHIPFVTSFMQIYYGSTQPSDSGLVVVNSKEVIDLFEDHNLKLVLQGHLHTVEDIYVNGTHFITGGAVSGRWWYGPNRGFEEGYILLSVKEDDFTWEYVDYGWEVDPAWPKDR